MRINQNDHVYTLSRYFINNYEEANNEFEEWLKNVIQDKIKLNLPRQAIESGNSIYISAAYFKHDWHYPFNPLYTKKRNFNLSLEEKTQRDFLNQEIYYKSKLFSLNQTVNYRMVAVPYLEKAGGVSPSRFMIYLIPNCVTDLSSLWTHFISETHGNFNEMLDSIIQNTYIDLFIPKIDSFKTTLDISVVFNHSCGKYMPHSLFSEMSSFLTINEEGTVAACVAIGCSLFSAKPRSEICIAEFPYISFIYDKNLSRILFFIKDQGI